VKLIGCSTPTAWSWAEQLRGEYSLAFPVCWLAHDCVPLIFALRMKRKMPTREIATSSECPFHQATNEGHDAA
jgi:hypothetical protein